MRAYPKMAYLAYLARLARIIGAAALAFVGGSAVTGCGDAPTTCVPACMTGFHCNQGLGSEGLVCVADPALDLAVSLDYSIPVDMARTCAPACAAGTYCNDTFHCVVCLKDSHCPAGEVCTSIAGTNVCLPGCASDDRCRGDGGAAMACCALRCVDTSRDVGNCGACGVACARANGSVACVAGACHLTTCNAGWGDCNGDPADGCETNLHTDAHNCAKCGQTCTAANGVAACSDGCYLAACNYGYDDCDGDPATGCEAAVLADVKNCGACGNTCYAVVHGRVECDAGACQISKCDVGYADCDGVEKTGCETLTLNDRNNCGKCGTVCGQAQVCANGICDCPPCNFPHAKAVCLANQCAIGVCLAGYADCNAVAKDGCEALVTSDALNCGTCGTVCAQGLVCTNGSCTCAKCNFPNATSTCPNNVCTFAACLAGFGDCDKNVANGCEANFLLDNNNCGACGTVCAGQTPFCVNGACIPTSVSCNAALIANPKAKSGVYGLDPDGAGGAPAFTAYCDMDTAGGGWTMVLNLDTSDGHVMWWGNALWENTAAYGDITSPFGADQKSPAWSSLTNATDILLIVHVQGAYRGWRQFHKVDGRTMHDYFVDNRDNTLIGDRTVAADTQNIDFGPERLVSISSQLFANHCVEHNGNCTSGAAGSPDGDRIGSNEGTPGDNDGGGLGNWHDMNYCCQKYQPLGSGKNCNGSTFRTTSEAQAGWASCWNKSQAGAFGSDAFAPWNQACVDKSCDASNWSMGSGVDYDYAIMLR